MSQTPFKEAEQEKPPEDFEGYPWENRDTFRENRGSRLRQQGGARDHRAGIGMSVRHDHPAWRRRFVWKKLARLWWQRRHHDQASSSCALRGGGQSRWASKW